jgi:hypothetical protein
VQFKLFDEISIQVAQFCDIFRSVTTNLAKFGCEISPEIARNHIKISRNTVLVGKQFLVRNFVSTLEQCQE